MSYILNGFAYYFFDTTPFGLFTFGFAYCYSFSIGYTLSSYYAISAASYFTSFFGCFFDNSTSFPLSSFIYNAPITSITNITDFYWGRFSRLLKVLGSILQSTKISKNFYKMDFFCWVSNGNFSSPSTINLLNNLLVLESSLRIDSTHSKPLRRTLGCFSSTKLLRKAVNLTKVNH